MNESKDDAPLSGLKVVELYAIGPVPFVGMQLQQLGASVVRVSPPRDRNIGIEVGAEADLLNRGKTRRAINLKSTDGLGEFRQLLSAADVLTEGFRPGVMERLTLAPEQLLKDHPRLVIGRLSGFGRYGPYAQRAGHDINYLALSGALAAIGTPDSPIVPLNLVADFGGGAMHLLTGILAKLVQRGINGHGGIVDASILSGTLSLTTMMHGLLAGGRWSLDRQVNLLDGGLPFYRVYRTRDDKFVAVGALEQNFFKELLVLTGLNAVISVDKQYDMKTWPTMILALSSAFAARTRDEWAADACKTDCCVTPVLDFTESLSHEHNIANGWVQQQPFPHPGSALTFPTPTQ